MSSVLDQLDGRVNAVADLVRDLRREIARLERELADRETIAPVQPPLEPSPEGPPPLPVDAGLLKELSRLREERALVRERVRSLIREIDQVAW